MNDNQHVAQLLDQYETYKKLSTQLSELSLKVAQAKLRKENNEILIAHYEAHRTALQELSDDMTFINPAVWMRYKYEAYKNEAQPIETLHDFRLHCSKVGYICTKRFEFLNAELEKRGLASLANKSVFPDSDTLLVAINHASIQSLTTDKAFMKQWSEYEFYMADGRVAKWENFSS